MVHVRRGDVGAAAHARMLRDGILYDCLGDAALAADISPTAAVRRSLLASIIPGHTAATGLAALWVHGLAPAPDAIDVVGPRGLHRTVPPAGAPSVAFHASSRPVPDDGDRPRVANVDRASVDALRYGPASQALPAVARALRCGALTPDALYEAAVAEDRRTPRHEAVVALVTALTAAVRGASLP